MPYAPFPLYVLSFQCYCNESYPQCHMRMRQCFPLSVLQALLQVMRSFTEEYRMRIYLQDISSSCCVCISSARGKIGIMFSWYYILSSLFNYIGGRSFRTVLLVFSIWIICQFEVWNSLCLIQFKLNLTKMSQENTGVSANLQRMKSLIGQSSSCEMPFCPQ